RKKLDLKITVPVDDMRNPGEVESDQEQIRSIWPAIYPELLALVKEHTSTIIFVNNRRAAERLAQRLNELDDEGTTQESPNRTATESKPAEDETAGPPSPPRLDRDGEEFLLA